MTLWLNGAPKSRLTTGFVSNRDTCRGDRGYMLQGLCYSYDINGVYSFVVHMYVQAHTDS